MENEIYVKKYHLLETAVGIWHDCPAIGCMQEQDARSETYGPFASEEQAVSERERLKALRTREIESNRWDFKDRWGLSGLTYKVFISGNDVPFGISDFEMRYEIKSNFEPVPNPSPNI